MNPLLQAPSLRRLLATARSRLRFAALLRGLAPGLWLAATALIVMLLLAQAPGWDTILLLIGGTALASMSITLYQSPTDNPRAAAAADYWLGGYGLITTAADILARQPLTLNAAEQQVLRQASAQAPEWTRALRGQFRFAAGPGLAPALATLLVAVFLLSLQSPAADNPVNPDRVNPDRVAPDPVAPDRVAPDRVAPDRVAPDRISAGGPVTRIDSAGPASANSSPTPAALDTAAAGDELAAARGSPKLATQPPPGASDNATGNLPPQEVAHSTAAVDPAAHAPALQRYGNGAASAAPTDSPASGLVASGSRNAQAISVPDYQPFVTGSSAAIVHRFFAQQEFSDE